MAINLSRNTRLWVSTAAAGSEDQTNTFEIGIQDGYSVGSQLNSTDISLNEAGATPNRGSARFNDSTNPVDWSISTYVRPYTATTPDRTLVADKLLWHALASNQTIDDEWDDAAKAVHATASQFNIAFDANSTHELAKIRLIFKIDNIYTIVDDVQVGSAEISVDIDGIGMVNWSGQGTDFSTSTTAPAFIASGAGTGFEAVPAAAKYLKNKLTTMSLVADANTGGTTYDIAITGASVTISNNITYLTPETLGTVDKPIGSFTGAFDVSGSLDCYLDTKAGGSYQLLSDMQANTNVKNGFNLVLKMGGPTGERMEMTMGTCHLSIPEMSIEDVVGTTVEFKALPSSADMNDGDEISIAIFES